MENFIFKPKGVCAKEFNFAIEDGVIKSFKSIGGCPGNLLGLEAAILNRDCDEVIEKFKEIKCGTRNTSCPMQISLALTEHLEQSK